MTNSTTNQPQPRSWKKRVEARSKISAARLAEAKDRARVQLQATESGRRVEGWSKDRADAADARLDEFGGTETGRKISSATKKFGSVVSKVPGLTAMADSVSVNNGVDLLTEVVKERPGDPEPKIHLAMALRRTQREMAQVRVVKAVIKPTTLITRVALQKSASLGAGERTPLEEKLLRAAFKQAAAVRDRRPTDGRNLHILARIYLLQDMPDQARQLSRLALAASAPNPGDVYVTLAEAERLAGDRPAVEHYANLAIKHGSTVGFRVLAEQALNSDASNSERAHRYEQYAVQVDPQHEERYDGVRSDQNRVDVLKRVARMHADKARGLTSAFSPRTAGSPAFSPPAFSTGEADLQAPPASSNHDNGNHQQFGPPAGRPVASPRWQDQPPVV